MTVEQVMGDGAYGSGANRVACARTPRSAGRSARTAGRPNDPEVAKSAFAIDLAAPHGHLPAGPHGHRPGRGPPKSGLPTWRFTLPRGYLRACPLFDRCVKSKTAGRTGANASVRGRTAGCPSATGNRRVQGTYPAAQRHRTQAGRTGSAGLRETRDLGHPKRQLQRLWQAATVN